jgi:hypothetical protein
MDTVTGGNGGNGMAAVGGGYRIGNVDLQPLRAGLLPMLAVIQSPFLTGEQGDDIELADIMAAIYVIARQKEAVRPLMGIERRRKAIEALKPMAEHSPGHFDSYIAAVERIESARDEFDAASLEFWDSIGGVDIQSACDTIFEMLNDAVSGYAEMPTDNTAGKKKANTEPSGTPD